MKKAIAALSAVMILLGLMAGTWTVSAKETEATIIELKEDSTHTYPFTVAADGRYVIRVEYRVLPGRSITPRLALTIDEPYQNKESTVYEFTRVWGDTREGERFKQDEFGNEIVYDETANNGAGAYVYVNAPVDADGNPLYTEKAKEVFGK